MTNCNTIKRLIDEAEQAEVLPFEATQHLNTCAPCRLFADERTSLRALLNQMPRVNAPVNFDAQLTARITTAKAQPSFAWANPALYLRFGAATAVLVVGVFVAQYSGMFSQSNNLVSTSETPSVTEPTPAQKSEVSPPVTTPIIPPSDTVATVSTPTRGIRRVRPVAVTLEDDSMTGSVRNFLVRGPDRREVELPMLPVSLGAQQQLINRSGRSSVQPIAISF